MLPEEDSESEEGKDTEKPHHFSEDLKSCEFVPMADINPTDELLIHGQAHLVFRNEDEANSNAEQETYFKDYFDDDGKVVEEFQEILNKPDDLSDMVDENDVVDSDALQNIFEKLAVQI